MFVETHKSSSSKNLQSLPPCNPCLLLLQLKEGQALQGREVGRLACGLGGGPTGARALAGGLCPRGAVRDLRRRAFCARALRSGTCSPPPAGSVVNCWRAARAGGARQCAARARRALDAPPEAATRHVRVLLQLGRAPRHMHCPAHAVSPVVSAAWGAGAGWSVGEDGRREQAGEGARCARGLVHRARRHSVSSPPPPLCRFCPPGAATGLPRLLSRPSP